MEGKNKILFELIQNTGYISKLILSSEIAMNDGDIETCQKYTKEAQSMLKTCINDNFEEYLSIIKNKVEDCNEYDLPTAIELSKQIACLQYEIGNFLLLDCSNKNLESLVEMKINKAINTIIHIFNEIYGN